MSVYKMASSSRELLLKIAELKDNIRRKYSALRNNDFETQRQLTLQYKPLIKPLQTLTQRAIKPYKVKSEVKKEPKEEPVPNDSEEEEEAEDREVENDSSVENRRSYDVLPEEEDDDDDTLEEDEGEEEEEVDDDDEDEDTQERSPSEWVPSFPPSDDETWSAPTGGVVDELLAKYLAFISQDTKGQADFTYGIVYNDGWKMGRYPVHFINNDIVIRGHRYKGTPGLFELIFKKHPSNIFTQGDLNTYKDMLLKTRAHVGKDGKVISSKGYKYTNIISNLFPPKRRFADDVSKVLTPIMTRAKRTLSKDHLANAEKRKKVGDGIMMRLTNHRVDYRHWDDPNELCERLQLLIASKDAGNTGHDSEMVSILEELKEAGVIKDFANVQL